MTTEDHIKVTLEDLQLALEREQQLSEDPKVQEALSAVRNAVLEVLGEPELKLEPEPEEQ